MTATDPTDPAPADSAASDAGAPGSAAPESTEPVRPRALHRAAVHRSDEPERAWTPVGTLDDGVLALVDRAGSVQLTGATWSLDWWVGAEDRWHHPSREASVRQHPVGGAPVVETALRVPGGDVVARAYGVQASAGEWRGPAVVVEVENLTAVPVALAFAVRPLQLDGPGSVRSVHSDGPVVSIDGSPRILLARSPARVVADRLDDVVGRLADGDDRTGPVSSERPTGDVEAAFVVPLTHTATARVLLPIAELGRGADGPTFPWDAPDGEAVAKGWSVHRRSDGGDELRLTVPEPEWDDALAWAATMLRLAGPDEVGSCLDRRRVTPFGPPAAVRAAEVAEAMARLGSRDGLVPVARGLADSQRLGGEVRLGDRTDGTVALLHAVSGVLAHETDPDGAAAQQFVAPAAVAVRRLRKGKGLVDGAADGLRDSAVRALRSLAPRLVAVGQPEVAEDALAVAAQLSSVVSPEVGALAAEPVIGVSSTLATALQARSAVQAGTGARAIAAVRACWSGAADRGRSDAVSRRAVDAPELAIGVLGFDVAELAARTNALLDVAVVDGADGPALLPAFDPAWAGQPIEAHAVATPWGATSFAVRWHGARPAVLWEISPEGDGSDDVEVVAPGLDPTWRGQGRVGEALLAAPAGAVVVEPDAAPSASDRSAGGADPSVDAGSSGGAGPGLPGEGDSFG